MSSLLFDIGGTSMRMAVGRDGRLHEVLKLPTPERPEDALELLASYVREACPEASEAHGGIAGLIEDGAIVRSPHLAPWDGFAFAARLAELLGIPATIQNDAELAALGEAAYGAGKGYALVGYLGIGTGVGGALVSDGKVAPHAHGFEPGHQVLDSETGATFEGLVSGHALEGHFGTPARDLERSVYDALTPTLAAGVYNVLLSWSPDVLVLGGSLMNEENGYRIASVERGIKDLPGVVPLPPLVRASLGDECGLYGALAVSRA